MSLSIHRQRCFHGCALHEWKLFDLRAIHEGFPQTQPTDPLWVYVLPSLCPVSKRLNQIPEYHLVEYSLAYALVDELIRIVS